MILTEAQAKQKRCTPAMVIQLLPMEQFNSLVARGAGLATPNCIGSGCMQWAWYDYANARGMTWRTVGADALEFAKGKASEPAGGKCNEFPARGFCGLTGTRE